MYLHFSHNAQSYININPHKLQGLKWVKFGDNQAFDRSGSTLWETTRFFCHIFELPKMLCQHQNPYMQIQHAIEGITFY